MECVHVVHVEAEGEEGLWAKWKSWFEILFFIVAKCSDAD